MSISDDDSRQLIPAYLRRTILSWGGGGLVDDEKILQAILEKKNHTSDHSWKKIRHLQGHGMQNFTLGRAL